MKELVNQVVTHLEDRNLEFIENLREATNDDNDTLIVDVGGHYYSDHNVDIVIRKAIERIYGADDTVGGIKEDIEFHIGVKELYNKLPKQKLSICQEDYDEIRLLIDEEEPKVIFITGSAGEGKTTTLRTLRDEFSAKSPIYSSLDYSGIGKLVKEGLDAGIIFLDLPVIVKEPLKDFLAISKWDIIVTHHFNPVECDLEVETDRRYW